MAAEGNESGQKTSGKSSTLYFNKADDFKKIIKLLIAGKLAITPEKIAEIEEVLSEDHSSYAQQITQEQLTVSISKEQISLFSRAFPRFYVPHRQQEGYSITANYMTWALLLGNDSLALLLLKHGDANQINADIKLQAINSYEWRKEYPDIVVNPIVIAVLLGKSDFIKCCYAKPGTAMPKIVERNYDSFHLGRYQTITQACLIEALFNKLQDRISSGQLTLPTVLDTLEELLKKPITKDTFFGSDDMPTYIFNRIIRLGRGQDRTVKRRIAILCVQAFEVYKNFRTNKRTDRSTLRTALRTKNPIIINAVLPWFTDNRERSIDCKTLSFCILNTLPHCRNLFSLA